MCCISSEFYAMLYILCLYPVYQYDNSRALYSGVAWGSCIYHITDLCWKSRAVHTQIFICSLYRIIFIFKFWDSKKLWGNPNFPPHRQFHQKNTKWLSLSNYNKFSTLERLSGGGADMPPLLPVIKLGLFEMHKQIYCDLEWLIDLTSMFEVWRV